MNLISLALITHVLVGLVGIMASGAVVMELVKRAGSLSFLRYAAAVAFLSYLLSWLSGGYYYVVHYGSEVKPIIKAGDYPWAHAVLMESKEHIFLFLPILSFVTVLLVLCFGKSLEDNPAVKRALVALSSVVFLIGIFITLSGVVISGAAR
jgi:hypothetical protein